MLKIENLNLTYNGKKNGKKITKEILHDLSFEVSEGECLVILGESGSGKSMTMKSILGLLDNNFTIGGSATLKTQNNENLELLNQGKENLRKIRGKDITMILQNPMTCFDSLYRVDYQMAETFQAHTNWTKTEIKEKSLEVLEKMQINQGEEVLKKYPHQLSGGMLQRIMIGIALVLEPKILVADEPTTAIDAITQFEIMKEFQCLKASNTTMIFITHDLGIASIIADHVLVINQGQVVDRGTFAEIIANPKDEYTKLLVEKRMSVMAKYKLVLEGKQ